MPSCVSGGDHPTQIVADPLMLFQNLRAVLPFHCLELRDAGQPGTEGIGLVGYFADSDPHGCLLARVTGCLGGGSTAHPADPAT